MSGDGEHATTLGALAGDAMRLAGALQARGIGPGDVVAVQLPGSYEGAVVQTAVGLCGAVLLPVLMIYGHREMSFVLERSGATAVFVPVITAAARTPSWSSRVYTHAGPGARSLGLFPPGHIAGLLSLLRILLLGTPRIIVQAWEAGLAARLIDKHAVTSSGGAPAQLSGLLDKQADGTATLATLREFLTGAAPVPPSLIRRADAALNATAFLPGGWFRTGDVGRLDGDGYLTVTDRLKDIIIRGGENISSREVEDLLITHPAVLDVAVIPAPDPVLGERVCAVVVLRPGFPFGLDEAKAHFRAAGAARQKTPEVIVPADELPRTPAGKVRKEVLRARLRSGPGPQPPP